MTENLDFKRLQGYRYREQPGKTEWRVAERSFPWRVADFTGGVRKQGSQIGL